MNKDEAKKIIKNVFTRKFDEKDFETFILNLFNSYKKLNKIVEKQFIKDKFKPQVLKYKVLGEYIDNENNKIDILLVALNNITTLQRTRTLQRNFIAYYLSDKNKQAALVAFVTDSDAKEWRFSLVKLDSSLEIVNDKLKSKKEITSARRWSFIVGENEGSHTAQSRFINLLQSEEKPSLTEIESAFNIETVTKEFFDKYTELFFNLKEYLDKILEGDESIKKDFENKEISAVDFAKKTLGQIVFLYFLQKKGWFGVPADKEWGSGPKRFIRALFDRRKKYGDNFFNDILEPLFYEALAQDRGGEAIYTKLNNVRMPFLNGGLFEPMNNYSWETTDILIPDDLFSNNYKDPKTGDIGNGILDVFDRYNFTVNENEPLEQEVAVDPEMLGKVFENLLDIKDRKSKGAFYTPREIVHYMCQETLIKYLDNQAEDIPKQDIEFFIKNGELILENDQKTADKIKEKKDKGYEYRGDYSFSLPVSIRNSSQIIDDLLYKIKVADPAVGSGAFPLGMLNEIVRARRVISAHLKTNKKVYTLKKETISNSLYGVDLDPGAVEIAKLRLWLSLVVDENTPSPLPNLDHKIMQGNSLISEYEGIKLFDESIFPKIEKNGSEKKFLIQKIKEKESIYLAGLQSGKFSTSDKNIKIAKELKQLKKDLEKIENKATNAVSAISLFDNSEESQLDIINKKTKELSQLTKKFISESQRTPKQELKKEIDDLKWDLIEMTLKQQGKEDKLEEIKKLRKKNEKPFFIWKLEFADVFKKNGGFDIVIGNPPYIQLQDKKKISAEMQKEYENQKYQTFVKSGDIYCLFYEHGNNILNNNGHLAFITSNKWMRAGYGEKLREYLSQKTSPKILLDLGPGVFETATVDTNILLFQKNKLENISCLACDIKIDLAKENIKLENYIAKNKIEIKNFSSEAWTILNPIEQRMKEKIEKIGAPLKDWDIKINRGILTGYNEAFIIDGKVKDELIKKDLKSAEIIKPILRGRDIKRYSFEFADKFLIASHNGYKNDRGEKIEAINIENYPAIKEWLDSHWEKISKRGDKGITPYNLRNCAYQEEFEKEKIVYSEIVQSPQFYFDQKKYFPEASSFLMTGENIKFLITILNSKPFTYFFKKFYAAGGLGKDGYRYKKKFLELVPIPQISESEQKPFIDKVNQIPEITSQEDYDSENPPAEQKNLEKEIDKMVYELYGLRGEEIKIIEK